VQVLYLGFCRFAHRSRLAGFAQLDCRTHCVGWPPYPWRPPSCSASGTAERGGFALPLADESPSDVNLAGPYRWIRYPDEIGQTLFYLSLAVLAANWAAASLFSAA